MPRQPSDQVHDLRMALQAKDAAEQVAGIVKQLLRDQVGLRSDETQQVLRLLGVRLRAEIDLESLFLIAHALKANADASGTMKRGTWKQIGSWAAEIWREQSGQPAYGHEEFRKAYAAWVGRGCQSSPDRAERKALARVEHLRAVTRERLAIAEAGGSKRKAK